MSVGLDPPEPVVAIADTFVPTQTFEVLGFFVRVPAVGAAL